MQLMTLAEQHQLPIVQKERSWDTLLLKRPHDLRNKSFMILSTWVRGSTGVELKIPSVRYFRKLIVWQVCFLEYGLVYLG